MPKGFVRAAGRALVDGAGQELLLRGIGLGNWLLPEGYMFGFQRPNSPRALNEVVSQLVGEEASRRFWSDFRQMYVDRSDIEFLASVGLNHVRVPFSYRLFVTDTDPRRLDGPGYDLLDQLVSWCREFGLYLVLDLHGAPGGQTGDNIDDSWGYPFLYEDERSQQLTEDLWVELARRFADEPVIAAYELLNEPVATHFDRDHFNPLLNLLYLRLIRAIRKVDSNHLIVLGGSRWNTDFSLFGEPPDDNLAYAFHRYWQEVNPGLISEYLGFSERWNVPLYMSESGENDDEWIAAFRVLLERHGIGWAFWPYKKIDSSRGIASIARPAGWDEVIAFAESPRSTYEEIRNEHPGISASNSVLEQYLRNLALDRCTIQNGYLKSLGLSSPGAGTDRGRDHEYHG